MRSKYIGELFSFIITALFHKQSEGELMAVFC